MKREDRRTLGGGGHPILCVRSVEMPALQDRVRRTENNNEAAISVFIKCHVTINLNFKYSAIRIRCNETTTDL